MFERSMGLFFYPHWNESRFMPVIYGSPDLFLPVLGPRRSLLVRTSPSSMEDRWLCRDSWQIERENGGICVRRRSRDVDQKFAEVQCSTTGGNYGNEWLQRDIR